MPAYADTYHDSTDGLRLYAREYPGPRADAPVLLCLPGLTRNSKDFEALAEELSRRYRVLCPDLRGRGRSARDPNSENYRPDVYGSDIFGLLDALGIDTFGVIGTSLGALMAMGMNALAPQRVLHVVLNDAGPELDPRGIARIASYTGKSAAPMTTWAEAAQRMAANYATAYPDFGPADWSSYARASCFRDSDGVIKFDYDPGIARGLASGSATPDLWPVFDLLAGKPVLVLRGELSDVLAEATVAKMRARLPTLRAATIPGRGHAPTLDEPAARAAIAGYLSASNGAPAT
ncbi:MAG: alpha/beta hydrolase [Proteobacteria bacterium]|nr:alpha/beta hydrolase [Pseudomonadota bacterium]